MFRRAIPLVLVLMGSAAAQAAAQEARASNCDTGDVVRYLGISGIDCNCTIGSPDADNWAFRTEPRVTSLIPQTRGGRLLRVGDVITHIDGKLITTREGARSMAAVKPGQTVILSVRRGGENLKFAIVAEVSCRADTRAEAYAPTPRPSTKPSPGKAYVHGAAPATTQITPTPQAAYAAQQRPARGSFGFGLMCSGNCEIRVEDNTGALYFSDPPEVYSVERGTGADKAGVRRGDVITHVNGQSITSKEGGRTFGMAKPGQTLRFTIRRNGVSRVVPLTAARPAVAVAELTKSSESLERAQQALRELQRAQAQQMEQIEDVIRRSRAAEESRVRDMQREFYKQEQEHRRKLTELSNELARAEARMRSALSDSMRAACAVNTITPRAGGSRTLRYTGMIGETEVEVRGPNPVTVTESGDEVIITAGSTQIRVKTPRNR
jgi:hypothetical protein